MEKGPVMNTGPDGVDGGGGAAVGGAMPEKGRGERQGEEAAGTRCGLRCAPAHPKRAPKARTQIFVLSLAVRCA